MKKQILLLTALFAVGTVGFGQVGIGTASPDPNSLLDLFSSEKGLLLPRVELTQLSNVAPLSAHIKGMIIYNTASVNDVKPGLYYNDGAKWVKMATEKNRIGDIKYGFQTADHEGWFLLDGRSVNALPDAAKQNAQALGLTNLLNAGNRFLKTTSSVESVGTMGGANNFTLTQANLPNIQFSGTTDTTGEHRHTYNYNIINTVNVGNDGGVNPIASNENLTRNTFSAGTHRHDLSFHSGGSGQPISYSPPYVSANVFIYLGN